MNVRLPKNLRLMVIHLVLSILMLFGAGLASVQAELVDRIVALVNDDIILLSEVEQRLKAIEADLAKQGVAPSQQARILDEQRPLVIARMVDDKLTDQQAARYNIEIDDQAVDQTILRIRQANRISEAQLRRQLDLTDTTYSQYRQQIRERMVRARLLNIEVKSRVVITDADVEAYYNRNKAAYASTVKYDLRHILLKVSATDDESRTKQIEKQAEAILARLRQGEAFEKMARLYSTAATAARGGKLGVFSEKSLTDNIRKALAGMEEKQFTDIVKTEQGFQIFFIDKIMRSGGKSPEEAKAEIQEKLYAERVDREFVTWLEDLREKSHIRIIE